MRTIIWAPISLAVVLVASTASATTDADPNFAFTGLAGDGALAGSYLLANSPTASNPVHMAKSSWVTWAFPVSLAAAGDVSHSTFHVEAYLTTPGDLVDVCFGYFQPVVGFSALACGTFTPEHVTRQILTPLGVSTPLDMGFVNQTIAPNTGADVGGHFIMPKGAYRAISLKSKNGNDLYPVASLLGSPAPSTATIPLPELPALVFLGLGVVSIGGLTLYRRHKGWS